MSFHQMRDAIEAACRAEWDRVGSKVVPFRAPEYIRWERDKVHHQYPDMLARIRSGCRISWDKEFRVHDETGRVFMLTEDPSKAVNVYLFRCSLAAQEREMAEDGRGPMWLTAPLGKW